MRGQNPAIRARAGAWLRFQHHRRGAITEQHAGAAILPIEQPRKRLSTDDERALVRPCGQELVRRRQREDETRADRLQIESDAAGSCRIAAWTCVATAGNV